MSLILLSLSGCETGSHANDSFCLIYEPIYTSPSDTEGTKRQVDKNNVAFLSLCEE